MNHSTDERIAGLEGKITNSFIELFKEAGEALPIRTWSDRFKLIGADAEDSMDGQGAWTITFEDTQAPYAHFLLHMNGEEPDEFSIDT